MVCDPNGDRINSYALVVYIPDPLGRFLDDLRRELVPAFKPHAHVTILPPRRLSADPKAGSEQARRWAEGCPPFDIELADVEIFPVTDVIFIGVRKGGTELEQMHRELNRNALAFNEPFPYHPHITLAQELAAGDVQRLADLARRRWSEFPHSRRFRAERAAFVQNTSQNRWIDLAEFPLQGREVAAPRVR